MSRRLGRAHIRTRGARPGGSDPVPKESESGSAQHRSTQYARTGGAPPGTPSTAMQSLRASLVTLTFQQSARTARPETPAAANAHAINALQATQPVTSNATQCPAFISLQFLFFYKVYKSQELVC